MDGPLLGRTPSPPWLAEYIDSAQPGPTFPHGTSACDPAWPAASTWPAGPVWAASTWPASAAAVPAIAMAVAARTPRRLRWPFENPIVITLAFRPCGPV